MDFNTTKPDTQNEPVKILIYNRWLQFYNKNQKECNIVTSDCWMLISPILELSKFISKFKLARNSYSTMKWSNVMYTLIYNAT